MKQRLRLCNKFLNTELLLNAVWCKLNSSREKKNSLAICLSHIPGFRKAVVLNQKCTLELERGRLASKGTFAAPLWPPQPAGLITGQTGDGGLAGRRRVETLCH